MEELNPPRKTLPRVGDAISSSSSGSDMGTGIATAVVSTMVKRRGAKAQCPVTGNRYFVPSKELDRGRLSRLDR